MRWRDVDAQGVVNNAVFLTLFEQARLAYFGPLGVLRGPGFPFLLAASTVQFRAPARCGDELRVAACVTRLGRSSFDMSYRVRRGGQGVADGSATLVWVDGELRPMPIPSPVRAAIAAREGIAAGPGEVQR
ncbi:MAG: acyl-CoA thioesterase [Planctomycetes bacterium]|nr:acyl-CoA thioesterase [Planctomycetota bacterium]